MLGAGHSGAWHVPTRTSVVPGGHSSPGLIWTALPDGLFDFANAGKNARLQNKGASGRFRGFHQILQHHQRVAALAVRVKGSSQAKLERGMVGRKCQGRTVDRHRFSVETRRQQRVGERLLQGDIIG